MEGRPSSHKSKQDGERAGSLTTQKVRACETQESRKKTVQGRDFGA